MRELYFWICFIVAVALYYVAVRQTMVAIWETKYRKCDRKCMALFAVIAGVVAAIMMGCCTVLCCFSSFGWLAVVLMSCAWLVAIPVFAFALMRLSFRLEQMKSKKARSH